MHAHLVPSLESPLMKFLTALALTLALATHAAAAPKNNEAANYFALLYAVEAPLHHAVKTNDFAAITALLDAGADPNLMKSKSNTVISALRHTKPNPERLLAAANGGNLRTVVIQLLVGADPNAKDAEGFTPLHYAAVPLHIKIVELLLSSGANPNARDNSENLTPLELINLAYSKEADRVAIWGESTGLVGSLFARNRLNQYRKRAKPVEALLEQASREWSWLDTLRQKLDW